MKQSDSVVPMVLPLSAIPSIPNIVSLSFYVTKQGFKTYDDAEHHTVKVLESSRLLTTHLSTYFVMPLGYLRFVRQNSKSPHARLYSELFANYNPQNAHLVTMYCHADHLPLVLQALGEISHQLLNVNSTVTKFNHLPVTVSAPSTAYDVYCQTPEPDWLALHKHNLGTD